jgi:hypothetical protein
MAGYTRQDVSNNIADGNIINASDFDNEYNAIEAAFNASTGHTHDGTSAEGAPITKIGPTQDVVAGASSLTPKTDNTVDLGSSVLEFKDLWIDGVANIDSLVADTADINAGTIDGASIGANSASSGAFTTLSASSTTTLSALTASTALALNASKEIVSVTNTGTGNNVLDTSPILVTPNLGTPSAVALTNATGLPLTTGVTGTLPVANGGTGQTTAQAAMNTFAGTTTSGQYLRGNGSNVVMSAIQAGDVPTLNQNTTGTASNVTGTVAVANGGTGLTSFTANGVLYASSTSALATGSALTFDGTTLGVTTGVNVGSGTSQGYLAGKILQFYNTGTGDGTINAADDTSSVVAIGINKTELKFYSSGSEQMRLNSTGLGIGTTNPGVKLDVQGTTARLLSGSASGLAFYDLGTDTTKVRWGVAGGANDFLTGSAQGDGCLFTMGGNALLFGIAQIERMRLDTSGNLGLGVTPSANDYTGVAQFKWIGHSVTPREVDNFALTMNAYHGGGGWKYGNTAAASAYIQSSTGHTWFTAPSGTAGNAISFVQAMTLGASGRWLLGTTAGVGSDFTSIRFDSAGSYPQGMNMVDSNASANGTIFQVFRKSDDTYLGNIRRNSTDNAIYVGGNSYLALGSGDTERARIPSTGGMVIGTAALATNATDGFLYVPTCAGTPTGTPTTQTGTAPIVVDTTNNKLYFYSGGQWRDAGP